MGHLGSPLGLLWGSLVAPWAPLGLHLELLGTLFGSMLVLFPVRAVAQGSLCPVGASLLYWGLTRHGAADFRIVKRRLFEKVDFNVF